MYLLSIDIGSTWTKGALFSMENGVMKLVSRDAIPTTQENLSEGVFEIKSRLTSKTPDMVRFSSSAKGGLGISVIGLVQDLSLYAGKLAAWSSGGKLISVHANGLTQSGMNEILSKHPDIILITGGTDGGHEEKIIRAATTVQESRFPGTVVYAGNSHIQEIISKIFKNRVVVTENIMPSLGSFQGEKASDIIRKVFLSEIVEGKGLGKVREILGCDPVPTPVSMMNLVDSITRFNENWGFFGAVDLGGATTDVYSSSTEDYTSGIVFRGLPEPLIKRTVEGDLGMRVSSKNTIENMDQNPETDNTGIQNWVKQISQDFSKISQSKEEKYMDRELARICIRNSMLRHCGEIEKVWTTEGEISVQKGRNLKKLKKLVLTGGYLSQFSDFSIYSSSFPGLPLIVDSKEKLIPQSPDIYFDDKYLWPLIGNFAEDFPEAAAAFAVESLSG
ncbi:MAG: glutamate mutase L [Deltaproteobacteria bacterium]|nr:glutamate mutase L [Deltaproteobacteria bacterium]